MKKSVFGIIIPAILAICLAGCSTDAESDTGNGGKKKLKYSVQVNNQLSPDMSLAAGIGAGDKVELYICGLSYLEDAKNRAMMLIANGSSGSKDVPGGAGNNAGWYGVNADWEVQNTVNNGKYSGFSMAIHKLRVNGTVYDLKPGVSPDTEFEDGTSHPVFFGHKTAAWRDGPSDSPYPFSPITMTASTVNLKTILTVEPGIIGTPSAAATADNPGYDSNGLSNDPHKYIKVEGIVSE